MKDSFFKRFRKIYVMDKKLLWNSEYEEKKKKKEIIRNRTMTAIRVLSSDWWISTGLLLQLQSYYRQRVPSETLTLLAVFCASSHTR